jgi:hypothetical protein
VADGTIERGTNAGSVVNAGSLSSASGGTLTIISALTNSGQISPGSDGAPGRITISGTFTQTPAGILNIDLGGVAPGKQYDQLVVTGVAALDGTINVSLLNGYTPAAGTIFQFLSFGSHTGTFANVVDTNIHDTVGFDVSYAGTSATLTSKTVPAQAPEAIAFVATLAPLPSNPTGRAPFSTVPVSGSASPANVPTSWQVGGLTFASGPAPAGVFASSTGILASPPALQLKSATGLVG